MTVDEALERIRDAMAHVLFPDDFRLAGTLRPILEEMVASQPKDGSVAGVPTRTDLDEMAVRAYLQKSDEELRAIVEDKGSMVGACDLAHRVLLARGES